MKALSGFCCVITAAMLQLAPLASAKPPEPVTISPAPGSTNVDPATTAVIAVFDQPMGKGMSWTGGGPHFPTVDEANEAGWIDDNTCVLPVKLEPAHVYRLGINSTTHKNFKNAEGEPAPPVTIAFATKGASESDLALLNAPKVVSFHPGNSATNVDPETDHMSVTFDQPMGGGMSWVGSGDSYPELQGKAEWSEDGRTCTMPIKLKPNHRYKIGINSSNHQNFSNKLGVPAKPVQYTFTTGAGD